MANGGGSPWPSRSGTTSTRRHCVARRGDAADRPRLGAAVQRPGSGWADRPQATGPAIAAEWRPPRGLGRGDRERADPRGAWRGALASGRPPPVAVGGVPGLGLEADAEPGAARHGLPEAVRPPAPPRPGRGGRHRGLRKSFAPVLEEVAREEGVEPGAIEVWFGDEAGSGRRN